MATRRVELQGAVITYGGRLNKIQWGAASRRIIAGGGHVASTISADLTCFVAGTQAQSKITKALARGVPVITEAQLLTLLEEGFVSWEEADPFESKQSFDESVAQLRAIFSAAPTSSAWTRCLSVIEGCDEERVEELVAYAQHFITRWDKAKMDKWRPPEAHPLMANAPKYWAKDLPKDELRVAPPRWVFELISGRHHVKHALARALSLDGMKLNGAHGAHVLASPHLRQLRFLNLGMSNSYSLGFFRELRTSELMRTVRELWIGSGLAQLEGAWDAPEHTFEALALCRPYDGSVNATLKKLPCLAGVKLKVQP